MASPSSETRREEELSRDIDRVEAAMREQQELIKGLAATAFKDPARAVDRLSAFALEHGVERAKALARNEDDVPRRMAIGALRGGLLAPRERERAEAAAQQLSNEIDTLARIERTYTSLINQLEAVRKRALSPEKEAEMQGLVQAQQQIYRQARAERVQRDEQTKKRRFRLKLK